MNPHERETIRFALVHLAELIGEVAKVQTKQLVRLTAEVQGIDAAAEFGDEMTKKLDQLIARMSEWTV